jgi:GMP synthase (glutamine-hydrolysing)
MTAPILELRHIECEPPGAYLPILEKYGELRTVRLWQEPVPEDPRDYAAIIVMGGPMGANDGAALPWIGEEIAFLRRAVDADVAVWGVCLGAQLLAAALGARVYTGPQPEVGIVDVTLTADGAADPVWGVAHRRVRALQWHSDTFDLPAGSTLLASSSAYPQQVFRAGRSYGVQFHLEADGELAQQWLAVREYRTALESAIGADAVTDFAGAIAAAEDASKALAGRMIGRWLDLVIN